MHEYIILILKHYSFFFSKLITLTIQLFECDKPTSGEWVWPYWICVIGVIQYWKYSNTHFLNQIQVKNWDIWQQLYEKPGRRDIWFTSVISATYIILFVYIHAFFIISKYLLFELWYQPFTSCIRRVNMIRTTENPIFMLNLCEKNKNVLI